MQGIFAKAKNSLLKAQSYYKKAHDRKVRLRKTPIKEGSYVYREIPEHPIGINPKLASQVDGPFRVIRNDNETIVIEVKGKPIRVNSNRLTPAPIPSLTNDAETGSSVPTTQMHPAKISPNDKIDSTPGSHGTEPIPSHFNLQNATNSPYLGELNHQIAQQEYEISRLVAAGYDDNNQLLFKVRWKGYGPSDDTWEPETSLPPSLVAEFKRKHNIS